MSNPREFLVFLSKKLGLLICGVFETGKTTRLHFSRAWVDFWEKSLNFTALSFFCTLKTGSYFVLSTITPSYLLEYHKKLLKKTKTPSYF